MTWLSDWIKEKELREEIASLEAKGIYIRGELAFSWIADETYSPDFETLDECLKDAHNYERSLKS